MAFVVACAVDPSGLNSRDGDVLTDATIDAPVQDAPSPPDAPSVDGPVEVDASTCPGVCPEVPCLRWEGTCTAEGICEYAPRIGAACELAGEACPGSCNAAGDCTAGTCENRALVHRAALTIVPREDRDVYESVFGTPTELICPEGHGAVGVRAVSLRDSDDRDRLRDLALLCAPLVLRDDGALTTSVEGPEVSVGPEPSAEPQIARCDPGMLLTGLKYGESSDRLGGLRMRCHQPTVSRTTSGGRTVDYVLARSGGRSEPEATVGISSGSNFDCNNPDFIRGLLTNLTPTGQYVFTLAARCGRFVDPPRTPRLGGDGGDRTIDLCQAGAIMTGIEARLGLGGADGQLAGYATRCTDQEVLDLGAGGLLLRAGAQTRAPTTGSRGSFSDTDPPPSADPEVRACAEGVVVELGATEMTSALSGLRGECRALATPTAAEPLTPTGAATSWSYGGAGEARGPFACPPGHLPRGVLVHHGASLNGIALECWQTFVGE